MAPKYSGLSFICSVILFLTSCNNPFAGVEQHEKYQPPEGLAGKLFSQMKTESDLTIFTRALELTGFDEVFNTSGSYTILAPTDSAFNEFFSLNPGYDSIADVPVAELERMVKFMTLQNSWNERQFRELSANDGWGSENSEEWKNSFVFKKETIYEQGLRKVWVDEEFRMIDSANSNGNYLEISSDYRKFMPVFTKEYFDYNDLSDKDYEYYFNRDLEINEQIYVADAKIISDGIFAANGFIYKIDKVVLPIDNTEEFLSKNKSYSLFFNLVKEFTDFSESFPYKIGNFQLDKEKINTNDERFAMYNHAGLVVPTNRAYVEFLENYLAAQGGIGGISDIFKREIINSFYPKEVKPLLSNELENGYYNFNREKVILDKEKIVEKQYTSNATVIGYDDFIIPDIFNSVGAPLVLSDKYRLLLDAVLQTGADNALKAPDQEYSFYIITDRNLEEDSSLYISENNGRLTSFDRSLSEQVQQSNEVLKTRILNQVAIGIPSGIPKKEFLPNLAGNYIVAEKLEDGGLMLSGKEISTFGYNERDTLFSIEIYPNEITLFNIKNGAAYEVNGWFNYGYKAKDRIVNLLKFSYDAFFNALRESGLLSQNEQSILFFNENLSYTIFMPTNEAFLKSGFENMTLEERRQFLKSHFIIGNKIFTDGKETAGLYKTSGNRNISLDPVIDAIHILDAAGNIYYTVDVNDEFSNVMLTSVKPEYDDDQEFTSYATTSVLHQIDTVLYPVGLLR